MVKRLFLSIDDSTLLNWRGQVASASVDSVKQAGVPVTMMSGLSPQEMAPLVKQLGPDCTQVAFNGALIYRMHHGKIQPLVTQSLLTKDVVYLLHSLMEVFPHLSQSYYDQKHWITCHYGTGIKELAQSMGIEPLLIGPATYLHPQNPVIKIQLAPSSAAERARLLQFLNYLAIPGFDIQMNVQGNIEIVSSGLSIANTVQRVMNLDGLHNDEIMGFGQDWNQLPFLQNVSAEIASIAAN